MQCLTQVRTTSAVPDGSPLLVCFHCSGAGQDGKVSGHDGKVHRTALGQLGDGTRSAALDQTCQKRGPRLIGKCLEKRRVEQAIDGCPPSCSLPGRAGLTLGYLRHCASIGSGPAGFKKLIESVCRICGRAGGPACRRAWTAGAYRWRGQRRVAQPPSFSPPRLRMMARSTSPTMICPTLSHCPRLSPRMRWTARLSSGNRQSSVVMRNKP